METWINFSWMGHLAPAQALPTLIQYAILWLKTYSDKRGKWYWLSASQRSWVQIPYRPEFFSDLISTTSSVVFIAARISYIRFFTAVHIYDFHISTIIIYVFCSSHLVYDIFYQFQLLTHCCFTGCGHALNIHWWMWQSWWRTDTLIRYWCVVFMSWAR